MDLVVTGPSPGLAVTFARRVFSLELFVVPLHSLCVFLTINTVCKIWTAGMAAGMPIFDSL